MTKRKIGDNTPVSTRSTAQVNELQVWAYPNPFTGQTNIQYYLPEAGGVNVFITDLNGKVRYQQQMSSAQVGWQQVMLNASDWNSGMYLLFIRTKETQVVKQLVIQQWFCFFHYLFLTVGRRLEFAFQLHESKITHHTPRLFTST